MRVAILAAPAAPARRGCTQRCEITLAASCWRAPFWLERLDSRLNLPSSELRSATFLTTRRPQVETSSYNRVVSCARGGIVGLVPGDLWLWTDLLLTYTSCIRPSLSCRLFDVALRRIHSVCPAELLARSLRVEPCDNLPPPSPRPAMSTRPALPLTCACVFAAAGHPKVRVRRRLRRPWTLTSV